jgi:hypothetical protein
MNRTGNRMGLVLRFGLAGVALISSILVIGAASASPSSPMVNGGVCSASGNTATGRQYAFIQESSRDAGVCIRTKLGGTAGNNVPDCWAARSHLGLYCVQIVDAN